jgi:hypothetical protein
LRELQRNKILMTHRKFSHRKFTRIINAFHNINCTFLQIPTME